jgi:hypothetical protein
LKPFKIQGRFKFEFVPKIVIEILREFEVVPKRKVVPFVSNYLYTQFCEFWTAGRSPFRTSKFGRLKILEIQNGAGARLSARDTA